MGQRGSAVQPLAAIAASFDERAASYARNAWHLRSAERLVELAHPAPGARVLDCGTGTGFAAIAAARVVGASGRVVGVDISPGMLAQARLAVEQAALGNVELIEGDACRLASLPDASFDGVLCATGLLYMPAREALSEWRRLVRPGGLVAFSSAAADSPRGARLFRDAASTLGVELADPCAPLGTPRRCRAALAAAGWEPGGVVAEQVRFTDEDLGLAWESNLKSAAHAPVRTLSADQLGLLRERFVASMQSEDPVTLRVVTMLYALGRRPEA